MTYRALDIHAHFRTGERKVPAQQNKDADKLFPGWREKLGVHK